MHHSLPSASVSMCQMRSARSLGAYSSIPSGCSSTCPSESTKSSGAVAVIGTPRVRAELNVTLEEPADESFLHFVYGGYASLGICDVSVVGVAVSVCIGIDLLRSRSDVLEHTPQV